eukprot:c28490_g1_i3 orf=830-2074(+)
MRTRRGAYPPLAEGITFSIRPAQPKRRWQSNERMHERSRKRAKVVNSEKPCSFDALHDDLLTSIMVALSSTANSPADLLNCMLTCKRFCAAGTQREVLANASVSAFAVKASSWSDGAYRFLKQCAEAGNADACYTYGLISFYCLQHRLDGASMMAKAAMSSHAGALHSLAVIQFNGSGGTRKDKDLKAGVALCARAASLGHVDAMRELGHCLQDGYGVTKNVTEGRRLFLEANAREAAAAVAASPTAFVETALQLAQSHRVGCVHHHLQYRSTFSKLEVAGPAVASIADGLNMEHHSVYRFLHGGGCSLLSDFGCNVPPPKLHVAHKFLVDWFAINPPAVGLRLCSQSNCGRPETRRHEFRRCSACGCVNYCSRACQALDWKLRHKRNCRPAVDQEDRDAQYDDNLAFADLYAS